MTTRATACPHCRNWRLYHQVFTCVDLFGNFLIVGSWTRGATFTYTFTGDDKPKRKRKTRRS